jgi:hypothetical protein
MNILELFKGTGSIGEYFSSRGNTVISLDILKKFKPTHCVDILEWDYKVYPVGHFEIIWASPECKVYSSLQQMHIGRKWTSQAHLDETRLEHSKYVKKVLEIIDYFKPKHWYIENPYYSKMRLLDCMKNIPSFRYDYCRFGFEYNKPTRIWTNRTDLEDVKCNCVGKHKYRLGMNGILLEGQVKDPTNTKNKYRIPQDLLCYLFKIHGGLTEVAC